MSVCIKYALLKCFVLSFSVMGIQMIGLFLVVQNECFQGLKRADFKFKMSLTT